MFWWPRENIQISVIGFSYWGAITSLKKTVYRWNPFEVWCFLIKGLHIFIKYFAKILQVLVGYVTGFHEEPGWKSERQIVLFFFKWFLQHRKFKRPALYHTAESLTVCYIMYLLCGYKREFKNFARNNRVFTNHSKNEAMKWDIKELKWMSWKRQEKVGEDKACLKEAGFLEAISKATPLAPATKMVGCITSEEAETLSDE